MVNVVRKAVDRAHGRLLLGRVSTCPVVLRHPGNDHLGVALGTQRAALKKWLAKVNTSGIDVQTGIDIVKRIYDKVKVLHHCRESIEANCN